MKFQILLRIILPAILTAVSAASALATGPVRPGSDRITEAPFRDWLRGKRIGVLAHFASRGSTGKHTVDLLAENFDLKMIFSPEHGFRQLDDTLVPDSVDLGTGLPVYSLYGPRRAPTAGMLAAIDVIVIDLQDVGLRYYTYPATVSYVLRAAKTAGKPVVLLDRPNPLGATLVDGARMDAAIAVGDLTTIARIPTQHGMTLGEIARYLNQELHIDADLNVVPVENGTREMTWAETGLTWYPSSPALPNADQVLLYSVLGTLESLPLAVGRGLKNDDAFRVYGAPWLTEKAAATLTERLQKIRGLSFTPYSWTPNRSLYQGELCHGFRVKITDAKQLEPLRILIETLKRLQEIAPSRIDLKLATRMLGATWLVEGIQKNRSTDALLERVKIDYVDFMSARESALLY